MIDTDRKLIEELEKRLCWYRDEATEEEFDAEEVDAICVMLQKLSPVTEPHMSEEEAYRNIMRRVREEEEAEKLHGADGEVTEKVSDFAEAKKKKTKKDDRKKRVLLSGGKRYRAAILFIAVFAAALFSLNTVTYAREDKSLFTMILERVGVLEIVKEATPEDSMIDSREDNEIFYDSWTELDSEMKSKIVVPEYIPNGYALYGIDYFNMINREKMKANYYNKEDGHLVVEITLWEDEERAYRESAMDENLYILLSDYSDENTLYYEYEDEYICMVFMSNSFYRISGNITLEEIIKVREGLCKIK